MGDYYDNEENNNVALFDDENGYTHVRKFKQSNIITTGMIGLLNGKLINKNLLYSMLECKSSEEQKKIENRKDGVIASVRWNNMTKGIEGGYFPHSIIIDIWMDDKKRHTKISDQTIQYVGIKSKELAEKLAEIVVRNVNECQDLINRIRENPEHLIDAVYWIWSNSYGAYTKAYDIIEINISEKKTMSVGKEIYDYNIKWVDYRDAPIELQYFVKEFLNRSTDLKYHYQIEKRLSDILKIGNIITEDFSFDRITHSMVNYNYHLGFIPNRQKLFHKLNDMGYKVYYPNVSKSCVILSITSDIKDDNHEIITKNNANTFEECFIFNPKGTITHRGYGGSSMEDCYYKVMEDLAKIKKDIEIKKISKK